jgi:hypothetical protein
MFEVAIIEVDSKAEEGVGCSPGKGSWTMVPFLIQGDTAIVGILMPKESKE